MTGQVPEALGTATPPMQLANLVHWSKTMEALHDIQNVSGAHGCSIAIVLVIQVLVRELLILETQRLECFFKVC